MIITARGHIAKCNALKIQPSNMTEDTIKKLEEHPLVFETPGYQAFEPDDVIGMDIETCSVKFEGGRFMVYGVGIFHMLCGLQQIEADTEEDITTSAPYVESPQPVE